MASANVPFFLYYGPGAAKSATKKTCLARGFARGLPDGDPGRSHEILSGMLSIPMVGLVSLGEGSWVSGSSMRRKAIPLRAPLMSDQEGNNTRGRPRVSARSDAAHRDARAPRPAPTHPSTRPGTYLDVPSRLERAARARCRLLVHVDKPPVLSEAPRWVS